MTSREKRRRRPGLRRKKSRRYVRTLIYLVLAVLCISAAVRIGAKLYLKNDIDTIQGSKDKSGNEEAGDWKLLLVNRDNPLPDQYKTEQVQLFNGESVDSRIYPQLQQMIDDAKKEGIYSFVVSGYRTEEKQKSIMEEKIQEFSAQGYSEEEAKEMAKTWVAVPGTSEHQTGLAVDINADTSRTGSGEVYSWLYENAYRYGFILRYPQEKVKVTGTNYEPWHYRYVGEKAAREIYESGVCLEEYLE